MQIQVDPAELEIISEREDVATVEYRGARFEIQSWVPITLTKRAGAIVEQKVLRQGITPADAAEMLEAKAKASSHAMLDFLSKTGEGRTDAPFARLLAPLDPQPTLLGRVPRRLHGVDMVLEPGHDAVKAAGTRRPTSDDHTTRRRHR